MRTMASNFSFRVVIVEVGEDDVELVAEIGKLPFEIRLGHLGIGDAGKAHAGFQRVTGEGAPTGADLEHGLTWAEPHCSMAQSNFRSSAFESGSSSLA